MCWRSSCAKRPALTAYSRITERWSNSPEASASTLTPRKISRNRMRLRGPGRRRVIASVAMSPRHTSSTQNAAPAAMRTTLLPGGVSAVPAAATASASALMPITAAARRTRALGTPTATTAASTSAAAHPRAATPGSTSNSARGSPGTIRLALTTTNGSHRSAAAPAALSSAPSRSMRANSGVLSPRDSRSNCDAGPFTGNAR